MPLPSDMQSTVDNTDSNWSMEPVRPGWYYVECTSVDLDVPLKSDESGRKAQFTFQVAPGQVDDEGNSVRRVKLFVHAKHHDEWGDKKIAAILKAYGLTSSCHESDILNGGVILGFVTIGRDRKFNELNGVKPSDGNYSYSRPEGNSAQSQNDAWD